MQKNLLLIAVFIVLAVPIVVQLSAEKDSEKRESPFARYPDTFSPELPYDVDTETLAKLNLNTQLPEAQRLFDIFSWQLFLGLNWPAKADGTPDTSKDLSDCSTERVWAYWMPNERLFLPTDELQSKTPGANTPAWKPGDVAKESHYLWRSSKMISETDSPRNSLHESNQAFTGPLVDQNGNFVRYESYMNKEQFDYIVENDLYTQEGQKVFTADKGKLIEFPVSDNSTKKRGSMGIKLAWKELGRNDIRQRYLTREVTIVKTTYGSDNKPIQTPVRATVGLVGMHVTALTKSSPNWVWATFEHVDNVASNDLDLVHTPDGVQRVRPNFNNPDLPTKLVNVLPPMNAVEDPATKKFTTWDESKTTEPVQLTRVVPIPLSLQALNAEVQGKLRRINSVFQYYELVGAQWPVQPGFPAFPGGDKSAPESILYKAPGRPIPVFVVNTTMESYFQTGEQDAGPLEEDDRLPFGFWADKPTERVTPDRTRVFATESCVGCHFSAGAVIAFRKNEKGEYLRDANGFKVPIYGKNASFGQTGNGAYLWQLQLKARQKEPAVKPATAGAQPKPVPAPGAVSRPTVLESEQK